MIWTEEERSYFESVRSKMENFDKVIRPDRVEGAKLPKEIQMGQKIELIADIGSPDAPAIAVVESAGIGGSDGVMITGEGRGEADAFVNAERPALREQLKREPNGDELLAAVLAGAHAARFRAVKAAP